MTKSGVAELSLGDISIDSYLPPVFLDEGTRALADRSRQQFEQVHGQLPIKFRIEEFCFQRPDQICTIDSPYKYLAWSAADTGLTSHILEQLNADDFPVVLRSHPLEFDLASPTVQLTSPNQLYGDESDVTQKFLSKINHQDTIVQLLKNPLLQRGLILCRPTFVYDSALKGRIQSAVNNGPQVPVHLDIGRRLPDTFAGIRVLPLIDFAREKKTRIGTFFAYDPITEQLVAKMGMPLEAQLQMEEFGWHAGRVVMGRTVDRRSGVTSLHYSDDRIGMSPNDIFLNEGDIHLLQGVLAWQLPRIVAFEEEIKSEAWIPQGLTNTHQFVIVPPEDASKREINTQYFDFHPHTSTDELNLLAERQGIDARLMSVPDMLQMYF